MGKLSTCNLTDVTTAQHHREFLPQVNTPCLEYPCHTNGRSPWKDNPGTIAFEVALIRL